MKRWIASLALVAVLGCGPGAPDLVVDVRTDLRPPGDFAAVRVTVAPREAAEGGDPPVPVEEVVPSFELEGDLVEGVRVAELPDLTPGDRIVTVALVDAVGSEVLSRRVAVRLREDRVLTVVLTRSCLGVTCPAADDAPELTECLGGRCVPPECDPEEPDAEACGELECAADADCTGGPACAEGRCADGACLLAPNDATCADGERCDVAIGCTAACTPGSCDDGNPCTDDACRPEGCVSTPNEARCDDGVFCNGPDTCADGACTVHAGDPCAAPTVCEESGRTCVGCTEDGDCPAAMDGPWSACAGFADACDETGTRVRRVTTYTCVDTSCEPGEMMESEDCARSTMDVSCGPGGATCQSQVCTCPGGATETTCDDGVDDDCDGDVDCADADCDGLTCGAGGRVCAGASCVDPGTEIDCQDGLDDDGDGDVDCADADCDGQTCAAGRVCMSSTCVCASGAPTALTDGSGGVGAAAVAWNGSEFTVVYMNEESGGFGYRLARVAEDGTLLATDRPLVSSGTVAQPPDLAWSGSDFGLVWSDTRSGTNDVYFRRFLPDGTLAGTERVVADSTDLEGFASLAWGTADTGFGLVWSQGPGVDLDLRASQIAGSSPIPPLTALDTVGAADSTHTAWAGGRFATVFHERRESAFHVYLAALDEGLRDLDGETQVDDGPGDASGADVAWTGTQLGIAWTDSRHGNDEIYFAPAASDGTVGANVRVTDAAGRSAGPALAWGDGGAEFGLVWQDDRDGTAQIYLRILDSAGMPESPERLLSCALTGARSPDVAWSGSRFGVVWVNEDPSGTYVLFRSVAP